MEIVGRRKVLVSSLALFTQGLLSKDANIGKANVAPAPQFSPVDSVLFDFVGDGLAQFMAKNHLATAVSQDFMTAAQMIKLAAHHLEETGLDSALTKAASKTRVAMSESGRKPGLVDAVRLVRKYDPSISSRDFLPGRAPNQEELSAAMAGLSNEGIGSHLFSFAGALKNSAPSGGAVGVPRSLGLGITNALTLAVHALPGFAVRTALPKQALHGLTVMNAMIIGIITFVSG